MVHEKLRGILEGHGKMWKLGENTIADLAMETATKQIPTTSSTPVLASPASASGASVIEAESSEYQSTPPRSGFFVVSRSTKEAFLRAASTAPVERREQDIRKHAPTEQSIEVAAYRRTPSIALYHSKKGKDGQEKTRIKLPPSLLEGQLHELPDGYRRRLNNLSGCFPRPGESSRTSNRRSSLGSENVELFSLSAHRVARDYGNWQQQQGLQEEAKVVERGTFLDAPKQAARTLAARRTKG